MHPLIDAFAYSVFIAQCLSALPDPRSFVWGWGGVAGRDQWVVQRFWYEEDYDWQYRQL